MNRMYIIDYIGNCDSLGNPIGHPVKVVNEFSNLLGKDVNIEIVIPKNYKSKLNLNTVKKTHLLNHYTDVTVKSNIVKFINKIKEAFNIIQVLKKCDDGVLWFINCDFVIYVILAFYKVKPMQSIWTTTYLKSYIGGSYIKNFLKNFFYKIGLKKIETIISSDRELLIDDKKHICIPDYIYDETLYGKYSNVNKKNQVVCVGTMTNDKDIEGLINLFNRIELPLKVIGRFYDKNRYDKLTKLAKKNIEIIDKNLDSDEYYRIIAESKFIILPYKKSFYSNRTSGVLVEAMFLNTIPIAPSFLLKYNNIDGIGFEELDELGELLENIDLCNKFKVKVDFNSEENFYNRQYIKKVIKQNMI